MAKKSAVTKAKAKAMSDKEAGGIVQRLQRASIIASGQKSTKLGGSKDPRGKNRLVVNPNGNGRLTKKGKFIPNKGADMQVKIGKRAKKRRAGAGGGGRSNK